MIVQQLQTDQVKALKEGDKPKLEILRYILAQIRNKEIEKKAPLIDEEAIAILRKITKELKESIAAFTQGKRDDLVREYQAQLTITNQYLPREISDADLETAVKKILAENQTLLQQSPKALIGICIGALKSQADPSRITKTVLTLLK